MPISTLRRLSLAATSLTAIAIVALTLLPPRAGGGCLFGLPCALAHFGLFALLGASLSGWYATSASARRSPRRTLLMLFLVLWLFAALDELAQPYVGRDASLEDWLLDMAGALVGLLGGSALLRAALRYVDRPPGG